MNESQNDHGDRRAEARGLRVLAVTRKPNSASFEHRVLDYIDPLGARGIDLTWQHMPKSLHRRGLRRSLGQYDVIWWHRYLIPPYLSRSWRRSARKILFDFDDPLIYSTHGSQHRPNFTRKWKFSSFLRKCDGATAASEYLADLARPYCPKVFILPMALDLPEAVRQRQAAPARVQLLWMGSRSTLKYFRPLMPVLERLAELRPTVKLRLVTHEPISSDKLDIDFRRWSPAEQEMALRECDIGLTPMPDTPWTRGKCPYKTLQYMAYGMAWVGTAVGENLTAAGAADKPDARGLCAANDQEWVSALSRLIDDAQLRARMGQNGSAYVAGHHELNVLADRLAEILRGLSGTAPAAG